MYADLNKNKLSNGEDLPTLKNYFITGTKDKHNTLMICEIKAAITHPDLDKFTTKETVELVHQMGIQDRVVYISFRFEILQWIKEMNPNAIVLYLEADKSLEQIANAKFNGINFHYSNFKNHATLANEAIAKKLKVGSWTVNELADFEQLKKMGVHLITTNYPETFLKAQ
jgi:glycerophosphoryl diester phosphodiesterase